MRILSFFPLFLLSFSTLVFCNRESVQDPPTENQFSEYFFGIEGISKNNKTISSEDAMTVARIYLQSKKRATKSDLAEEPIPIKDNKGVVQMYAINSGDSYVLVSSTKAFVPIVAVCDGYYDESVVIPAEQIVIDELCHQIAWNKTVEAYDKYADSWRLYEKNDNAFESLKGTKSSNPWQVYYDSLTVEWEDRDVYLISNAQGNIPNDIYQSFSDIVDQEYQNSACVYPQFAVVTVEDTSQEYQKGPYTKTTWGQGYPYNSSVPGGYPLGCLTVAVAQMMRSVGLPAGILWSTMPDSGSNTYMSNFLNSVRTGMDTDTTGSSNFSKALAFLSGYSYNCYTDDHDFSDVISSLTNRRLVIMRGSRFDSSNVEHGHAWVCDGFIFGYPATKYSLYVLVQYGSDLEYYNRDTEEVVAYNSAYRYFHMNWGWEGSHNGYYYEDDVEPSVDTNYCYYRRNLYVTNRYALYY